MAILQTSHDEESFKKRFLIVLGLLLSTVVGTLILVGLKKEWVIHGNLYDTINNARATTQIVVQIISNLLGAIHVFTICQVINFGSRIALKQRSMTLEELKFRIALTTSSVEWNIPLKNRTWTLIFFLLTLGPSALWAGAITPVQTSTLLTSGVSINLPRYSETSYSLWSQNTYDNNPTDKVVNSQGTFSYLPLQDRFGYLIADGSAASSVDGRPQLRAKNDNSNYTYIGRSFGVGSSVGLADKNLQDGDRTIGYQYVETGYYPSFECIYNSTSQFELLVVQPGEATELWTTPYLYLATGSGPNTTKSNGCAAGDLTQCGGIITAGLGGDADIVAGAWWASFESGLAGDGLPRIGSYVHTTRPPLSKAFTSLVSGSGNQNLNRTQCSISMIPASFSISVNTLDRTIVVTPQNNSNVADIEPSGFIADSASSALAVMSSIDMTLIGSVLGTMLQRNIANVQQQNNDSTTIDENTLQGVAECLQVLADDYLLAIASAQLIVAKDFIIVPATIVSHALNIGDERYAIAVVVLNSLIFLIFIEEAVRTRCWQGLPKFDYSDTTGVIVASFRGGGRMATAKACSNQVGDFCDRADHEIEAKLEIPVSGPAITLTLTGHTTANADSNRVSKLDDHTADSIETRSLLPNAQLDEIPLTNIF